jgi:hypothetical protein
LLARPQALRRLAGDEEDAAGEPLGRAPGVLHRQARLADAAETVDHSRLDDRRRGAGVGVEAAEHRVAALEEVAEGWVGQVVDRSLGDELRVVVAQQLAVLDHLVGDVIPRPEAHREGAPLLLRGADLPRRLLGAGVALRRGGDDQAPQGGLELPRLGHLVLDLSAGRLPLVPLALHGRAGP